MTAIILNSLIVILELISCYLAFNHSGIKALVFYTVLSNIMGLISSALYVGYAVGGGKPPMWVSSFRYTATVCLTVTFLVVMLVLLPFEIKSGDPARILYKGANLGHHILCPILAIVSLLFFDEMGALGTRELFIAFSFTIAYAVVLIILNVLKKVRGPYPFLLVYEQPFYMSLFWLVLIVGSSFGIAALMKLLVSVLNKN